MHANTRMPRHIESNYSVQPIWAIGLRLVPARSIAIQYHVGAVADMREGRMPVDVVVRDPMSNCLAILTDKRNLMSFPIED